MPPGYDPQVIHYEGTLYRPPSEANSLVLQATVGCSYNECAFCGMYRAKKFRIRKIDELRAEIDWAHEHMRKVRKVFLADGDALMAPPKFLNQVIDALNEAFPDLRRISCYASPQALQVRSVEQMSALREKGLTLYYLGVESGHDTVLERLTKGVDAAEMIRVAGKATDAGVKLSTMFLLGAGGRALSLEHARESARVANAIQPRFVSTLVMTPVEDTPLWETAMQGGFDDMDPVELTAELREFVANLELDGTVFRSNHASNYLPLAGTFPKDKDAVLAAIDDILAAPDANVFVPEWLRGL